MTAKQMVYMQETGMSEENYFESLFDDFDDRAVPVDEALLLVREVMGL